MSILMAGIDCKTAEVSQREAFSLTSQGVIQALGEIKAAPGVEGCVLLSTCNRTELYLSGTRLPDPAKLLCNCLHNPHDRYARCFTRRENRSAASHLMMVSAGLRSQLRGEDQILGQVKAALELAREVACAGSVLETLFRNAISAAKRAKTLAPLAPVEHSLAHKSVALLEQREPLEGKQALVIGNGEMGRLAAKLLAEAGCLVTVTLRSYRHGISVVPHRCGCIPYEERYQAAEQSDLLVSATTSPHYTVTLEELSRLARTPRLLVDLAVPRDIDPAVRELGGVTLWNVDDLGGNAPGPESAARLMEIHGILGEYLARFAHWQSYRERLSHMDVQLAPLQTK